MLRSMNVLHRCPQFLRSYSNGTTIPELAKVARTASTPLAVRLRRRKQFGSVEKGATDATQTGLTPSEKSRYARLRATKEIQMDPATGKELSETEWLDHINARRSRIRGFARKVQKLTGDVDIEAVGRRIYLPNILLKLVRNYTAPGQAYNPYEATFHIPQSVTKTDLRSLLLTMYGVKTTYIRTDNYFSPWYRSVLGWTRRSYKTYKRAIVGLVDPFYYPHRLEDMAVDKRQERKDWLEQNFAIQLSRSTRKSELMRLTQGDCKANYKLKGPTKRSHIIRLVNERREKREQLVTGFAKEIRLMRREKEGIDFIKLKDRVSSKNSSVTE